MCGAAGVSKRSPERRPEQRDLGMFGLGGRRNAERIEPRLDDSGRSRAGRYDLRADPDDRPGRKTKRPASKARRRGGKRKGGRSRLGRLFYWCFVLGVWCAVGLAGLLIYYASQLPPIDQLAVPKRPPNIAILADNGALIANRGDTGGAAVHLSDLPPYLPKAFVAIEDRRFYSHFGIDPIGIGRAVFRDVTGRGGMEGGSTLTQQLAKNLFLTQERTLSRKIQEAILALWLERKYSKDQILELYLNRVYFGSGAYGVEAAAQKYFGKSARLVNLSEAAVLAGLMKSPTRLAPNHNLEAANARAAQVITAMAEQGHITEAMAKLALAKPATVVHEKGSGSINYAADYVMDMLDDTVGAIDEDIVVTTTLDEKMQGLAEHALTDELNSKGEKYGVGQGAIVALDPNGAVKALVGGRNYADSQFDRAVAAKRQPGSAFKPFVYLSALEKGLTPDTVREDGPITVKGWNPENYSREYFGPVTLTKALSLSLNTVAVRLGLEVGPKTVVKTAHRLGIASDLEPNASIALGTSEVTPLELVSAYAAFANGGIGVQAHVISRVRTANGKQLYARKNASFGRVIDPQYVAMMNTMMEETLLTGTAHKAELPGWQAAGKTGTSQEWRDAWFVGYTSYLVAGVWLGNDDGTPTKKVSGGNLPVEIWSRFMKAAHEGVPVAALPSGVWRNADAPAPESAPPIAPPDPPAPIAEAPGQPMTINRGGIALQQPAPVQAAPLQAPPRRDIAPVNIPGGPPIPPASIPNVGSGSAPPPRERSLLGKLFGGA
jgi:penicillin-binding protein 1A